MPGMAELRERIRQAAHEAGGYRTLARRSGGLVSHSTLNNIVIGRHSGNLTEDRIRGIALALNVATSKVAEMAGVDMTDAMPPFKLPQRADRLSQPQRRLIISIVDALLAAEERGNKRAAKRAASASGREQWNDEEWDRRIQSAIESTRTKADLAKALTHLRDSDG